MESGTGWNAARAVWLTTGLYSDSSYNLTIRATAWNPEAGWTERYSDRRGDQFTPHHGAGWTGAGDWAMAGAAARRRPGERQLVGGLNL